MATNKNITMKQFNGTDYDTLYPKTVAAQIPDVFSQSETVNAEMLSKYGLGANSTPNDVFGVLSRFQNGLGNEYVWAKYGTVHHDAGYTLGATTSLWVSSGGGASVGSEQYNYSDSVSVADDGTVSLVNPSSIYLPINTIDDKHTQMFGKYVERTKITGTIFYIPTDCTMSLLTSTTNNQVVFDKSNKLTGYAPYDTMELIGYVNSPNPSAYPPAVSDGYAYNSLGQLGSASHIEIISYVGTGTVGSNNPTSLTFKMPPKLFLIQVGKENVAYTNFLVARNTTVGNSISGSSYYNNNITWTNFGKTVSWYCTGGWGGLSSIGADAQGQMNSSGVTYTVIAFE